MVLLFVKQTFSKLFLAAKLASSPRLGEKTTGQRIPRRSRTKAERKQNEIVTFDYTRCVAKIIIP